MGTAERPLETFDVSVLGGEGHVWLSVYTEQGSVFGIPRPLPDWGRPGGYEKPGDWLTDAVARARDARTGARAVGAVLTELLFGIPDVAVLLQQARGVVGAVGGQVLVRILAAPQDVSAWPWELLVDPQRPDRFLTLARDVHVIRSGRTRTYPVRQAPIEPPLNLLLVMSSPVPEGPAEPDAPFDLYAEKRSLLTELLPLVDRGLLSIEVEDRPTVENLRSRIGAQRRGFHLLHYLGHARPDGLKLEHRSGRGRMVASQDFARLLQQMPDLRLAVFAGCETARAPAATGPDLADQMSTADYCVRDASPLVVGMQAVLPFSTERLFSRFFYQALTAGQAVVEALRLARLAIEDDEFAGGTLVNWAVPCLYVGGNLPGPITDPALPIEPIHRPRRIGLRLGVRQGELRFISRLTELREAVDVLCGRKSVRLLHLIGLPGTGKTALLDRTVEELDIEVVHLFVSIGVLLSEADAVRELCRLVVEQVARTGRRTTPQGKLDPSNWWQRLLEDLTDVRLALVLDDGDLLTADTPEASRLLAAVVAMTERRGRARVAVAANEEVVGLTRALTSAELSKITLQPLSWQEVWQWIRRNLPVLTRYEEWDLAPFFHDLPHLEQWEALAEVIRSGDTPAAGGLPAIVERLSEQMSGTTRASLARSPTQGTPPATPDQAARRVLRVAVAGPYTAGREAEFSRVVTQFAAKLWVSGRIVAGESPDGISPLAELLSLPSPFAEQRGATPDSTKAWIEQAVTAGADLLVLDYGSDREQPADTELLNGLMADGRLVIAAGGNQNGPCYPAFIPGVLAIGALDTATNQDAPYSQHFPDPDKPDLYAPESLSQVGVEALVADPNVKGTSMAAIYAAAAAILVWATDRGLSGKDVRQILLESASAFRTARYTETRRLDINAALHRTRAQLVLDTLEWDALGLQQVLAETGLRPEVLVPLLDSIAPAELTRTTVDGTERFENPTALYLEYARLRQQPPGSERTQRQQRLVERAKELARRGRYTPAKVEALWATGHDGRRVVALGVMQERPELAFVSMVTDAISAPRSYFEQYQALVVADQMTEPRQTGFALAAGDGARLYAAVQANRPGAGGDPTRTNLADKILRALTPPATAP